MDLRIFKNKMTLNKNYPNSTLNLKSPSYCSNIEFVKWIEYNDYPIPIRIFDIKIENGCIILDVEFSSGIFKNLRINDIKTKEWFIYVKEYLIHYYKNSKYLIFYNLSKFIKDSNILKTFNNSNIFDLPNVKFLKIRNRLEFEMSELNVLEKKIILDFNRRFKNLNYYQITNLEKAIHLIWDYCHEIEYNDNSPKFKFNLSKFFKNNPEFEIFRNNIDVLKLNEPKHPLILFSLLGDYYNLGDKTQYRIYENILRTLYPKLYKRRNFLVDKINGKSILGSEYEMNYINRSKIQKFIKEGKLLNLDYITEFRLHLLNVINEGYIKYKFDFANKENFILSYTQLSYILDQTDLIHLFDNLFDSKIDKIDDYDFSVTNIQIKYDKGVKKLNKKKFIDKIHKANIRSKFDCFYNSLKMLINDRKIKISNLREKLRFKNINVQIDIFEKFQDKYKLHKKEIHDKMSKFVNNIEKSCLIIFPINTMEFHTVFCDENFQTRSDDLSKDFTYLEFHHNFIKFEVVTKYSSDDLMVIHEFSKTVQDFKIFE